MSSFFDLTAFSASSSSSPPPPVAPRSALSALDTSILPAFGAHASKLNLIRPYSRFAKSLLNDLAIWANETFPSSSSPASSSSSDTSSVHRRRWRRRPRRPRRSSAAELHRHRVCPRAYRCPSATPARVFGNRESPDEFREANPAKPPGELLRLLHRPRVRQQGQGHDRRRELLRGGHEELAKAGYSERHVGLADGGEWKVLRVISLAVRRRIGPRCNRPPRPARRLWLR